MPSPAHEHNRRAWDQRVREKKRFTIPAGDDRFAEPLAIVDGVGWLGSDIQGKRVLCLAAGGGNHAALYATAGAIVTVVDLSSAMLELDRQVAMERRLELRTVETSMDDLSMFEPGEFDIVIHPVSTCYVPQIVPVFQQVARVTRAGGLYISQHKQPASLQADIRPSAHGYELCEPYYRSGPLPEVVGSLHREEGTWEFLHRWEEIIGGMCQAGFVIEDLLEPRHDKPGAPPGTFGHRSHFVAPYVRIKARRIGGAKSHAERRIWTP